MSRLVPYAGYDPSEPAELEPVRPYRSRGSYERREPTWWAEARRLAACRMTAEQVAAALGMRLRNVRRALDPAYREQMRREDARRYRCARGADFSQPKED